MKRTPEIENRTSHVPADLVPELDQTALSGRPARQSMLRQFFRFGLVGSLNTLLDLLVLNVLFWLFPVQNALWLAAANSIVYGFGAINSFFLNKYWTFGQKQPITLAQVGRFVATTCLGMLVNDGFVWAIGNLLRPFISDLTIWTNLSKILAIAGSISISYLGMRLWVFARNTERVPSMRTSSFPADIQKHVTTHGGTPTDAPRPTQSLSVVLPAYNEEQIIARTIAVVVTELTSWNIDFEVIVVNDGSTDRTGECVAAFARGEPYIHLITHDINRGYGAALTSGFAAATKELTFFMDSDGQFRICDLQRFFPFIANYDAVIGYRLERQDGPLRKLNAWGWNLVVRLMLGVHVRDIDCAFKLIHTRFFHEYPLETGSALINAELLYKLEQAGGSYREVGVHHLPRQGGRATGANLKVILRAFRDLFAYSWRWKRAKQPLKQTRATLQERRKK